MARMSGNVFTGVQNAMALDRLSDFVAETDCVDELLPGTTLFHGQYRIKRFINSGGFGITYLASDSLNRDVVLKECFVGAFCRRSDTRVRPRSEGSKLPLQKVMRGFLNEARALAALSHPNIVRVQQVFEDNDTAYMALDYISGHDLLEVIDEKKMELTPRQIVTMARKLVSALGHIHSRQLLHCDISPDNICVTPDAEPILIDFGAARKSASGEAQKHTGFSLVKDGYSPYEFYSTGGSCGPWSDIYSLGASLYHAVSGATPADCQSRLSAMIEGRPDPLQPLAGQVDGYPPRFLESIDRAMAVQLSARFQSAQDWLVALPPPQVTRDRNVLLVRKSLVVPRPVEVRTASSGPTITL
jgi:serine/threonine protein kinase